MSTKFELDVFPDTMSYKIANFSSISSDVTILSFVIHILLYINYFLSDDELLFIDIANVMGI